MITMVTDDYKVIVIKVQEIEKKWRGNLMKTMGLVKLRFPLRERIKLILLYLLQSRHLERYKQNLGKVKKSRGKQELKQKKKHLYLPLAVFIAQVLVGPSVKLHKEII